MDDDQGHAFAMHALFLNNSRDPKKIFGQYTIQPWERKADP